MSPKASACNKVTIQLTPPCAQICAEAIPLAQNTFRRTNFNWTEERKSAFVFKYKILLQIFFTALKQTDVCQNSVQGRIQNASGSNWRWISRCNGSDCYIGTPKINWWVLKETRKEHTFHLQVKLSQMDFQCPFYKAHVLEERLNSHHDWKAAQSSYLPNTCHFLISSLKDFGFFFLLLHRIVDLLEQFTVSYLPLLFFVKIV